MGSLLFVLCLFRLPDGLQPADAPIVAVPAMAIWRWKEARAGGDEFFWKGGECDATR